MENFKLPTEGIAHDELLKTMQDFRKDDIDWKNGRTFCLVYHVDEKYYEFLKKAHNTFFSENALNPMAFKSVKEMERQAIRMTINMFNGNTDCVGTMTSGGTESIMMAVKTFRDRARKIKPWILKPEIVAPITIHPAFNKACDYFDVKLKLVAVDETYRVNFKELKKAVGRNTIMIAASAPQYPHGVVDPIEAIASFADKKGIPFHVDACFGGFILPWLKKAGVDVPSFDFSIKGVTSMSADFHKYGYAASKGSSAILYSSMDYMKYQFYVYENWPGGIYLSPSFPGSKSGGAIATAWAALMSMGESGYVKQAHKIKETTEKLVLEIEKMPELELIGSQDFGIVCIKSSSKKLSIYAVADVLAEKGWHFDRNQKPESIHLTISPHHESFIDEFITDLGVAVEFVKEHPELDSSGNAAMYGMIAKMPLRGMVKKSVIAIMQQMYSFEGKMPDGGPSSGPPQNIMEALEKVGYQAIEVKKQLEEVMENIKGRFKND